ncbi:hypothetical protein [Neobacillus sp. 19]|uniref:hypothetical protein n=1 Tax=Neobacillus sp. 19 TaxID=3394458 RepID=UPI003BF7244F
MPREVRLGKIEELTEGYRAATGEWPDSVALERLADLCLYEELTDTDRMKVRNNEYPIMSDEQLSRRQEGKHVRKNDNPNIEVPLAIAGSVGADGRCHAQPARRVRSDRESSIVDKEAKSRNKERKRKYVEFTRVQPVFTKSLTDL